MIREGIGRYRIGDYSIVHEQWHIWRVWWLPVAHQDRVRAGVAGEGFPTLREARTYVETEVEADRQISI